MIARLLDDWKAVYRYREFLKNTVAKDLRTRYKGSILGFLWTFVSPLLMLVVYSTLFSVIIRMPVDHYPIFLFCTLLSWNYFSSAVQSSSSIIVASGNLIKKIYFPLEILPISVVTGGLINYLYGLIILIPALVLYGYYPNIHYLWLPVIIAIQFVFTLALAFLFSALTVFFRDLEHILSIVLMAWLYLTPVLYPVSLIPEEYQYLFGLNPMSVIINSYRDIFYYNQAPDSSLLVFGILAVGLLVLSHAYFSKVKFRFVEEI